MLPPTISRRDFLRCSVLALVAVPPPARAAPARFHLRYALASSMYGNLPLAVVLPEVQKTGATVIDLWPPRHGTQRTEADDIGDERLTELLRAHGTRIGVTTRYDLGALALKDEIAFARRHRVELIVTGVKARGGFAGLALKTETRRFVEDMKPLLAAAGEAGTVIAIENHANSLIDTPDSIRWLADFSRDLPLGIALAPYHLEQDTGMIAGLIRSLGPKLALFYAWQHGKGSTGQISKSDQLLQMPGRGPLDFKPLLRALRDIEFSGWTEIFMHPVPRGVPILPSASEVTDEINRGRNYLETHLSALT
jgi:sugar phosphate isomerase/epimerase